MKAMVIERQGGPEGLVFRDWPDPELREGDVLVKVRACGLNHLDIFVRRGMPDFPVPLPFISGSDVAGTVEAWGSEVEGFEVGDRVVLNPTSADGTLGETIPGGMAELVRSPAAQVIRLPDSVGFEEAACLPVAYGTAHRMLIARAALQAGETVLVLGASGGVGTAAVQIARNLGARVVACAGSEEKCRRLFELGADHVVNGAETDFAAEVWRWSEKRGVDLVVNFTGGDSWVPSLRCLRRGGRLVTCGATAGFDPPTDLRYIWSRELTILGSTGWRTEGIRELVSAVERGSVTPVISHVLPLTEAREGERLLEQREVFGKVLLIP